MFYEIISSITNRIKCFRIEIQKLLSSFSIGNLLKSKAYYDRENIQAEFLAQ